MGLRNRHQYEEHFSFFVTTTCYNWMPFIQQSNTFSIIENTLQFVSEKFHTKILAYVIMPNHIHLILHFTKTNHLSAFMRDFKKFTSVEIKKRLNKNISPKIWMDRFDDVYIRDKSHLEVKLAYIHHNPLQEKWNLSSTPEKYLFSSASYYYLGEHSSQLKTTHYLDIF
ncbi:MAG: transposase [Cytophagaceae bacterium]|nr:transposase [Cytophagaceae bacterium]